METKELVTKLLGYMGKGENLKAEEELYADDVVSYEQDGTTTKGKAAAIAKTKAFLDTVETFHGGGVEQTYVSPDSFLLMIEMDFTPKGGQRTKMKEFGFYNVKNGKVSEEHFLSQPFVA